MEIGSVAVIAAGVLAFSLVSGRLRNSVLTPPMVFIAFGLLISSAGMGVAEVNLSHAAIHVVAELTLILVLFSDAARIDLRHVRRDHNLPLRMLSIGLPLTIVAGTIVAVMMFPAFSIWEAVLLAALLAPTDAALGQSVVTASSVPVRIRQTINIESGLNDGIALPVVLLFASIAAGEAAADAPNWLSFAVLQVTLGPLCGAILGYAGARLLDKSVDLAWAGESFQGIGILALAVLIYVVTEIVGGNGFIAAFVGGMVFGSTLRHPSNFLFEFMDTEGHLLVLITFLLFGAALLPDALLHVDAAFVFYAVLSLTAVRMIPIAISLLGTGLSAPTVLFLGWFGPRGLASVLFVLLILEETAVPHREDLLVITVITVALSALLHGLTAAPLAALYGRRVGRLEGREEHRPVIELPLRTGHRYDPIDRSQ